MKKTMTLLVLFISSSLFLGAQAMDKEKKFKKVSFTCHDNSKKKLDTSDGKTYAKWKNKSIEYCKDKCSKKSKKCGVNTLKVEKLTNKKKEEFKKPADIIVDKKAKAYKAVLFTCTNVKTIFKELDKGCKMTRKAWKKYATRVCTKILGAEEKVVLNSYSVSMPCHESKDDDETHNDDSKTNQK